MSFVERIIDGHPVIYGTEAPTGAIQRLTPIQITTLTELGHRVATSDPMKWEDKSNPIYVVTGDDIATIVHIQTVSGDETVNSNWFYDSTGQIITPSTGESGLILTPIKIPNQCRFRFTTGFLILGQCWYPGTKMHIHRPSDGYYMTSPIKSSSKLISILKFQTDRICALRQSIIRDLRMQLQSQFRNSEYPYVYRMPLDCGEKTETIQKWVTQYLTASEFTSFDGKFEMIPVDAERLEIRVSVDLNLSGVERISNLSPVRSDLNLSEAYPNLPPGINPYLERN